MNKATCTTDEYGTKQWYLNGQLHRADGPAVEWADGDKHWFLDGKLHRLNGPAITATRNGGLTVMYGTKTWWLDGEPFKPAKLD